MVGPTPQELIHALYAAGGRVRFAGDPPTLLVPKTLKETLAAHRNLLRSAIDLREAGRRAATFREQIAVWVRSGRAAVPVLALSEVEPSEGQCISCGDNLLYGHWRCGTCTLAMYDALRSTADDSQAGT